MSANYYEILEVEKTATKEEIKSAFRKKAIKLHPDVNKAPDAEEKFKELGKAYEVLMDDEKRALYDQYGEEGLNGAGYSQQGPFDFGFGGLDEIFSSFFGDMGGFSSRRVDPNAPQRGSDLSYQLEIDFEEAIFGAEKDIPLEHLEPCKVCSGSGVEAGYKKETCTTCKGSGHIKKVSRTILGNITQIVPCPNCSGTGQMNPHPCKKCKGSGQSMAKKTISIKIPQGIDTGMKMRVSQEGDCGKNGGPSGDLFVFIRIKPHKIFQRNNINLFINYPISLAQAALGDEVDIPLPGDRLTKLKIPSGIQDGDTLKIKGEGVPYLNNPTQKGDIFVKIKLLTPKKISQEEEKLYRRLLEIEKQSKEKQSESLLSKFKEAISR